MLDKRIDPYEEVIEKAYEKLEEKQMEKIFMDRNINTTFERPEPKTEPPRGRP